MQNPWVHLPEQAPYVLPDDRPHVEEFNRFWRRGDPRHLMLDMFPDPFIGSRSAPVLILARNPGVGGKEDIKLHKSRSDLLAVMRRNLTAPPSRARHTYFQPEFAGTPGGRWWRSTVVSLTRAGISEGSLAEGLFMVEFHGYHSESYTTMPITLPSQQYGFWLVREAISRGAVVLVMRAERDWHIAVPELAVCDKVFANRVPQSSSITAGNYGVKGFRTVVAALS